MRRFLVLAGRRRSPAAAVATTSAGTPAAAHGRARLHAQRRARRHLRRGRAPGPTRRTACGSGSARPAGGSPDSLKLLATGRADIAVLDIHDLGLALERGADVVGVGALVQRPLAAVIARARLGGHAPARARGPARRRRRPAVRRRRAARGGRGRRRRLRRRWTASRSASARSRTCWPGRWMPPRRSGTPRASCCASAGCETREFRVDDFGAPRYPEVVLVVRRDTLEERRDDIAAAVKAIADGTEAALADRRRRCKEIAAGLRVRRGPRARADRGDRPGDDAAARVAARGRRGLGRFASEFGILEREPDVDRAFEFDLLS